MAERPLACEEWQPVLAGWLVAQLSPDEEERLAAHLDGCPSCRVEAGSLMHVAALTLGAEAGAVASDDPPPADLGDRIVARVARERRARRAGQVALAMSAAAAAVLAGTLVTRDGGEPALRGEPVSFVRQASGVDASAVLAPDGGGSLIELTATGLDPNLTYSLWLTPPGGSYADRIPAGTFRPDGDGEVDVRLRCALPADEMGRAWATTPEGDVALDTEA
jgi:Putative zinc-finger